MTQFSMAAPHAAGKGSQPDPVFSVLKEANAAIDRLGLDKVVNASIGAIYDEEEKFASFHAVREYFQQLDPEEMMNYSPIGGLPEFHKAAIEQTFGNYFPARMYAAAVATPGGTGAVRHTFNNYLSQGDKVLVPDWAWGNYRTVADEHMRGIDTYQLFDENNCFNVTSVKEKVRQVLTTQDQLVIVFNTPAHNPTGHSMTEENWVAVLDFFRECSADKKKKITLLLDIAYIDYAGTAADTRKFFRLFTDLPENILVAIAYSMSKSYLIYGMRSGAFIGLSSSQEVIDELSRISVASNRGVWSNGTRGAQRLLADVQKDPELRERIEKERTYYRDLMAKRAGIFMAEAKDVAMKTFPYHSGFFITVPAPDPKAACAKLVQENIFALPLKAGIRVAICAIPVNKVPGLATKMKKSL